MISFTKGLDLRLHVPLLLHSVIAQTTISLLKVNLSYRAIELGLPVIWIGVISATFAIVPIFIGLWIGRFIDRGNDALAVWIGSSVMLVACAGFVALPSNAVTLLLANITLGLGHMFFMPGGQMVCERSGAAGGARELAFGNYMVANALGAGLGPLVLGVLAGNARIPDTTLLFQVGLAGAVATAAMAFVMRPALKSDKARGASTVMPVGELLRQPGMMIAICASVMTIVTADLMTIYLPLLGIERGIDASHIGLALTIRAISTMVSRLLYAKTIEVVGRVPLMLTTITAGAVGMLLLALPLPLWLIYVACAISGFSLGFAATATLTSVVSAAPANGRATAISLRIMGNRVGQVSLPLIGGVIATASGAGGVFFLTAIGLLVSAVGIHHRRDELK